VYCALASSQQPALATDRFILILIALWNWVGTKAGPTKTGPLHLAIRKRLVHIQLRRAILSKRFHDGTLSPPKRRAQTPAYRDPAATLRVAVRADAELGGGGGLADADSVERPRDGRVEGGLAGSGGGRRALYDGCQP
jgi:hypothetical protein